jgi:ribonuclease BN (tRNA processing enzyme)
MHDSQYSDEEYPAHVGWGHSALSHALTFAKRTEAGRLMLFHHDPMHSDDFLDEFSRTAVEQWEAMGCNPAMLEMATERSELELRGTKQAV